MIRRLKGDILKQLPKKHREIAQVAVEDDDERAALRCMYLEVKRRESESAAKKKARKIADREGALSASSKDFVGLAMVLESLWK